MPGAAIDGISLLKGVLDAFDVKDMEELLPGLISRRAPQNPYDEWQLLLSGGDIAVSPNDNHMEHLIEHESVMQMPEFQMLPPEVQQIWMMHGQKHQMYFQMMQPAPQGGPNDKNGGGDQKSNKVDAGQYNRSSPSQSSLMRGASGGGSGMGV
jgi:hypothetical protein